MSLNSALMFNYRIDQLAGVTRAGNWWQSQPANKPNQGRELWFLLLIILIFFVWWLLQREATQQLTAQVTQQPIQQVTQPKALVSAAPIAVVKPIIVPSVSAMASPIALSAPAKMVDNLTKIEGIGPKIHGVLHAAGIKTFADLSKTEVRQLRQILVGVGMKVNDPATWPEQAALAAAGKWIELEKLQEQLNGGRRA